MNINKIVLLGVIGLCLLVFSGSEVLGDIAEYNYTVESNIWSLEGEKCDKETLDLTDLYNPMDTCDARTDTTSDSDWDSDDSSKIETTKGDGTDDGVYNLNYVDIQEEISSIDEIIFTYVGHVSSDVGMDSFPYVYNWTSGTYIKYSAIELPTSETTWIFNSTAEGFAINDIVNSSGYFFWGIFEEATYAGLRFLYQDYAKLDVYYTPNTAPVISDIAYNPATITHNANFVVDATVTDADADASTVYFELFVNDGSLLNKSFSSVATGTNQTWTIGAGNYTVGDEINISVYANDGTADGTKVWSTAYTILNQKPVLSTFALTSASGLNSTLDDLTATETGATDGDSDVWAVNYECFNGGVLNATRVITDNLVAWFPMDDDMTDFSGNELTSTVSGASHTTATLAQFGSGSYTFNGVGDYINLGSSQVYNKTGDQSFSAWFNPDDETIGMIYSTDNTLGGGTQVYFGAGNEINIMINNGTHKIYKAPLGSGSVNIDGWNFIGFSYDASTHTMVVHLNGVTLFDGTPDSSVQTHDFDSAMIGIETSGGSYSFDGQIDELALWTSVLTATQFRQLYEGTRIDTDGTKITIDSSLTLRPEVWTCNATIYDKYDVGTELESNSLTIANAVPTITSITLTAGANNYTTEDLTCTPTGQTDADTDYWAINYEWYNGGTLNASRIITNGLVSWFPFDNDAKDYAGANDGTVTEAILNTTGGKIGGGYEFDGVDDYITLSNKFDHSITDSFTYSAWIYTDHPSYYKGGVICGAGTNDVCLACRDTGDCYLWYDGESSLASTPVGGWTHLVGVFDNSVNKRRLYVNGVLGDEDTQVVVTAENFTTIFGKNGYGYFNGTIDEPQLYNRALTAQEITQLYYGSKYSSSQTSSVIDSSLTLKTEVWTCNTTIYDSTSGTDEDESNSLTILNTPPTVPSSLTLTPATSYVGSILDGDCSGSTDADSDSIAYHYRFYNENDATERQAYSTDDTYVLTTADAHDTINVTCKSYDGTVYSSGIIEATKTTTNTPPQVNQTIPYDTDHNLITQHTYQFEYFDLDGDTSNCSLWIDNAFEGEDLAVTTDDSITSASTLTDGVYTWYIRCLDGNGGQNDTGNFTYVVDTINPNINPNTPKHDNSTIVEKNFQTLTLDISGTDTYLFAGKVELLNSSNSVLWQKNETGIATTYHNFTDSINLSTWPEATYKINITYVDDHTAKSINPYMVEKGDKYLRYLTDSNTEIIITEGSQQGNPLKRLDTTKEVDRYTFDFEFKNKQKQVSFYVESSEKIWDRSALWDFPAFVTGKHWIDFNSDGIQDYSVFKINDYKYLINLIPDNDKGNWTFKSLGGLNTQNEMYSFVARTNDAPSITEINITPTTVYTNDTLSCNIATSDPEGDSVSLTYAWLNNSVVLAGETTSTLDLSSIGGDTEGLNFTCQATPNDGWQDGAVSEDSVIVSNWAPVITVASVSNIFKLDTGQTWNYDFDATELDSGDTLTWSDDSAYFNIGASTGTINFTTSDANVGHHVVEVNVTDGTAIDTISFNFIVLNTTLNAISYTMPSTYTVGNNVSAFRILNVSNPSATINATGLAYTFGSTGEWSATTTKVFSGESVAIGVPETWKVSLTMRPAVEDSYTPVYSNGVAVDGYEEYVYDTYVNISTDKTNVSTIRNAIVVGRMPASYSNRNINRDVGELNDTSAGVNLITSQYIDVTNTFSSSYSLMSGNRYKFTYKYYVYAGAVDSSPAGGGGTPPAYTIIDPQPTAGCPVFLPLREYIFSESTLSHQVFIRNSGNQSYNPVIEWVEIDGHPYSGKGLFDILTSVFSVLPGEEEAYVIRYNGNFNHSRAKIMFRVYNNEAKDCYQEALFSTQSEDTFDLVEWLTMEVGKTGQIFGTDRTVSFQNWLFLILIGILSLGIAIRIMFVQGINVFATGILYLIFHVILGGLYALGMSYLI